jgi:hypothetical protein
MAYSNQLTSSLSDFITKLDTFLTANGWTQDQLVSGKWAIHNSTVYASARYDTGTPNYLGLYHALGYTGGNDPGNHPNDSGNGAISGTDATLQGARGALITNTPVQYWAFAGTTFAHVVVQVDSNPDFVHFGFGIGEKIGTWTGGEYLYGNRFVVDTNAHAVTSRCSHLLDGSAITSGSAPDMELFCATVHAEGFPNQGGTSKWGVCLGFQSSSALGLDRASVARIHLPGTYRANLWAPFFSRHGGSSEKGLLPGSPIGVVHWNRTTNDVAGPLLILPQVRSVMMEFFAAAEEITIGAETWVIFPQRRKSTSGGSSSANSSGYAGIAYRKS